MRLVLHTVICCCVFTMVLPLVKGATGELNSSLKKRFKVRLQSRMKRNLGNNLETANEKYSDINVGPQQDGEQDNAKSVSPPVSFGLKIRPRRSSSKACVLGTCVYHDLIHQLHKIQNSNQKDAIAPAIKISCTGYGRRRRSLLDVTLLALQTGRQRRSAKAGQQDWKPKSTCTVA